MSAGLDRLSGHPTCVRLTPAIRALALRAPHPRHPRPCGNRLRRVADKLRRAALKEARGARGGAGEEEGDEDAAGGGDDDLVVEVVPAGAGAGAAAAEDEDEDEDECGMCMAPLGSADTAILPCGHMLHAQCGCAARAGAEAEAGRGGCRRR